MRYGWRGERDSRGDTNWVPADQVERIEVIRGPAAARYGSGAMGGVINIITKQPAGETHGNMTVYQNFPQHGDEFGCEKVHKGGFAAAWRRGQRSIHPDPRKERGANILSRSGNCFGTCRNVFLR